MIAKLRKLLLFLTLTTLLSACNADDTRSVTLVGYNYTARPIAGFTVDGVGGGNIFVNGGGASFVCCGDIAIGKPAEIKWTYSYTNAQYERGIRELERHSTTVIVPQPQTPEADYLEVHFYPDNHVELALVKFPGKRRLPRIPEDD